MPWTREALAEGEISRSAALVLVAACEADPDEFSRVEEGLVETARTLDIRDVKRAVAHWRQAVDHRGAEEDAEHVFQLRRLHVSPTLEGMVRVDGDLDPETGQVLITALRSVVDAEERQPGTDRRTFAQRRADALGEICRRWLDSTERPQVSGERPHVTITVDLEALEGRSGFRCELGDTARSPPRSPGGGPAMPPSPESSPEAGPSRSRRDAAPVVPASLPGGGGPGRRLQVPGLRPSPGVVRCPPRPALGRWRTDLAFQPGPAVPAASPVGPPGVRGGHGPRWTGVPPAGRHTPGRSRAACYMWAMSCSTRSSTERKGSLHSTVRWAWSFSFRWTQSTV